MDKFRKGTGKAKGSFYDNQPIDDITVEEIAFAKYPKNKKRFHLWMEGGSMWDEVIAKIKAGAVKLSDLLAQLKAEGIEIPEVKPEGDKGVVKNAGSGTSTTTKVDKPVAADTTSATLESVMAEVRQLRSENKKQSDTIAGMLLEKKSMDIKLELDKLHIAMDKSKLAGLWAVCEAAGQLDVFKELLASYDSATKFMFDTKGVPSGEAATESAALTKLAKIAAENKTDLMTAARSNIDLALEAGLVPQLGRR